MLSKEVLTLTIALLHTSLYIVPAHCTSQSHQESTYHSPRDFTRFLSRRAYIAPGQQRDTYDYVVAGGGLAGLVLASKLAEDGTRSVLVVEAGPSGDEFPSRINTPAETYYNSLLGSMPYDWTYSTVPQPNAGGRNMNQPRGRLLGGSSAINGMYHVRPSAVEVDTWASLASDDDSQSSRWKWSNFFQALKATETFSPPVDDALKTAGMKYSADAHGSNGKLRVTYPAYMVPVTGDWLPTLSAAGIPAIDDAYSGNNIGGFFALSTINPSNWTRSYSKSAYIDALPSLSNLHVLSGATVSRIVFADNIVAGNRQASAVEFSTEKGGQVYSVNVGKEVVLSGGAMGSPHVLMVSGVGPRDVLEAAGVDVKVELPGVGQHLMDHLAAGVFWESNVDTQGTIKNSNSDFSKSREFNSFVNSGIAYINGTYLFGSDAAFKSFTDGIVSTLSSVASSTPSGLVPSIYPEVIEGYKAIFQATAEKIHASAGLMEMLLSINAPGQIAVQAALQQPLSHGRVYITSKDIWDKLNIDPAYFSHGADIVQLREGIKLARRIGATAPLSAALGREVTPGPDVQSDSQIEDWLRNGGANTEFHPCGTSAMMPKEKGGVVGPDLKVFGTDNVRVVDASVFPISFSAHLMAPTYALAEQAADLIINPPSSPSPSGTNTNTNPNGGGASQTGTGSGSKPTGGAGAMRIGGVWVGVLVGLVGAALAL
ncbi:mala s 12 allergen [Panaeolus papilionaceus]|nr:mala s 12 allergen [Panaeolus papilionaceus]